jgi:hypothetical protein
MLLAVECGEARFFALMEVRTPGQDRLMAVYGMMTVKCLPMSSWPSLHRSGRLWEENPDGYGPRQNMLADLFS